VRVEFRSYPRTYIPNIYEQHTFAIACNEDKQTNKTVTVGGIPTEKQPNIQQTNKRCNLLYYELYFTGLHLTMSVVCGCATADGLQYIRIWNASLVFLMAKKLFYTQ